MPPLRFSGCQIIAPLLLLIGAALISACSSIPSGVARQQQADRLAAEKNWHALPIASSQGMLKAYLPTQIRPDPAAVLTVFIEGDGLAWVSRSQPSSDPTPIDPLALRLALIHPGRQAAYLGRPCQYVDAETTACPSRLWLAQRFSEDATTLTDRALDELKQRFQANRLVLVGFSGGGTIAALIAARRSDVAVLITLGGNLDHAEWTRFHHITSLEGSLNPADEAERLQWVRQLHFVGAQDTIVPPQIVEHYAQRFPPTRRPLVRIVADANHHCCWVQQWPRYWQTALEQLGLPPRP